MRPECKPLLAPAQWSLGWVRGGRKDTLRLGFKGAVDMQAWAMIVVVDGKGHQVADGRRQAYSVRLPPLLEVAAGNGLVRAFEGPLDRGAAPALTQLPHTLD
ncbi:hypothetical protein AAKU55_002372 [Oxalobacteraceae bacterium GrIS 1.11]